MAFTLLGPVMLWTSGVTKEISGKSQLKGAHLLP